MKYLLDVSSLVAFGVLQHEFHVRTASWVRTLASAEQPELLTCSITELGFVRVLSQTARYGLTFGQAQALLLRVKSEGEITFSLIPDDHDITHLPVWVKYASQITDGHLLELARARGARLATLDKGIPGAFLIPAEV
jgi:predicted nucleic acid-binding protein